MCFPFFDRFANIVTMLIMQNGCCHERLLLLN